MAASTLTFTGKNSTDQGWSFALYQKQPVEMRLDSIAWKVVKFSKPQSGGSITQSISWKLTFAITIAGQGDGDVYTSGVTMEAREGYDYEAVMQEGYIQIRETGKGKAGYINIKNGMAQ